MNRKNKLVILLINLLCLSLCLSGLATSLADNTNLAPVPSAWTGGFEDVGYWSNVIFNTTSTYGGVESIQINPLTVGGNSADNVARDCVGPAIQISPGDNIVFECWIRTSPSTLNDYNNPFAGGRIGIDMYNGCTRITGVGPDGGNIYDNASDTKFVEWGTSTWTLLTMNFTVPSCYQSDGELYPCNGFPAGQYVNPTMMIPWLQVWSDVYGASDGGYAQFGGMNIMINPSGLSTPAQNTTITPTPTPTTSTNSTITPTPTSTPTPTPMPIANNLAPIPNGWTTADTGMEWGIGGVANVVLDTNVLYNGNPTIRIDPPGNTGNAARECDGPYISIAPGDQIVFSCWIKTTASSLGDTNPNSGGRIGIDFYSAAGRITGTDAPDGSVWTPTGGWPNGQTYVNWNTNTWTQVTISFTVPSTYPADGTTGSYSAGQLVIPTAIIPWMQVWSSTYGASDQGQAWFANSQLTITIP